MKRIITLTILLNIIRLTRGKYKKIFVLLQPKIIDYNDEEVYLSRQPGTDALRA